MKKILLNFYSSFGNSYSKTLKSNNFNSKQNFIRNCIVVLSLLLFSGTLNAQTTVTKYFTGPTQEIDGCGSDYCATVGSVNFTSGDFPAGAVITDVKVTITWQKTGGTCSAPTSDLPNNAEISFRIDAPDLNIGLPLAPELTWSGETQGGVVTTVFDDAGTTAPSGTPTSGTFKPAGVVTFANNFNGLAPFGIWQLMAGDTFSNNNALCVYNFSVTITANVPPTAVCKTNQLTEIFLDENGQATLTPQDLDGGSSDAEGPVTLSLSKDTFDCSEVGQNFPVTLTVTDFAGETDSCVTPIWVRDTMQPVVSCKDATVILDANGSYQLTKNDLDNGSTDNCSADNNLTYTFSPAWFYCKDVGVHTVTMTVEDEHGNSASCDATVTVSKGEDLAITDAYPVDICYGAAANTGKIVLKWAGIAQEVILKPDGGIATTYNSGLENGELDITGLVAGNYTLEINGICGQMVSSTVEIKQLEELAIANAVPIDICFGAGGSTGKIDLEWNGSVNFIGIQSTYPNGGTGSRSIDQGLDNGYTTIDNFPAGIHEITLYGTCSKTVSTTVEIKQLEELAIANAVPIDICFGAGSSTGKIDLEWDGSVNFIGIQSTYPNGGTGSRSIDQGLDNGYTTIENFPAGIHEITLYGTCSETVSTTVEIKQLEELAIANAEPIDICFGAGSSTGKIDLEWDGSVNFIGIQSTYPNGGTGSRSID
ncbi:DUF5011/hyalin repeat domain-containing protein [Tenacibaculum caenipelagi]|uniref:HYR domain-containing protein n=1 Tax=Tenacibaculum caenipelagi TaxID=1325435 RepID=A0A4R6TLN4_9FLAO|nr:hypothetical protein [Tenacibaculum caenipelagi]TDQ30344.1 hypothetical protein DFQ07_0686 [Tenacibaculum caenipelagi]